MDGNGVRAESVETRTSWVVATVALVVLSVSYGAPLTTVVALKPIAAEFGASRSAPALAVALTFIGAGCGGIAMGWLAERIGVRWVVLFGGMMIGTGLTISSLGGLTQLYVSSFLLVGLLGAAGMFAPLMTYVSRWFDRRRGTAIALISAGQYIAGALWPALFQFGIDEIGWRQTMLAYAVLVIVVILPLAAIYLRHPPDVGALGSLYSGPRVGEPVLGWPPNLVLAALAFATFCCCMTMSMPMAHMVAFCSDIGIAPTQGAAMLSVLLGSAFFARQFWGWLADRVGGLRTILWASAAQALAMAGFLLTQDEVGLFTIRWADPRLRAGSARVVPGVGGKLAHSDDAVSRLARHGCGRLAGRRDVRPLWVLRTGLRGGGCIQCAEPRGDRHVGTAPTPDARGDRAGLNMAAFICTTCGTQYPETEFPPPGCRICQDERQYVNPLGQTWTTLDRMRLTHFNAFRRHEPWLIGIGTAPSFAIGQRALLLRTRTGNVLWDCVSFIDEATVEIVQALGGISAIAISHPHFYASMVEWSHAFDRAPIYLHAADEQWVVRPDKVVTFWEGEVRQVAPGVTLLRCGGHFAGGTVLHWHDGAAGRGALLSGDIVRVGPDRKASFMRSYPDLIPLDARSVQHIADVLDGWQFDAIYGAMWGSVIPSDGKVALAYSVRRYLHAISTPPID
jgi:MFS family permease